MQDLGAEVLSIRHDRGAVEHVAAEDAAEEHGVDPILVRFAVLIGLHNRIREVQARPVEAPLPGAHGANREVASIGPNFVLLV